MSCLHDVHPLDICMKKFYCEKINFDKMTATRTNTIFLSFFTSKGFHGPISSYHSFCWNNLISCLHDVHPLDICMKKFYCEKNNF